jgi:hypothetical protein
VAISCNYLRYLFRFGASYPQEGMRMKNELWQLFLDTGAPEAYLLYKAKEAEEQNVSEYSGHRPQSHGLQ